MVTCGSERVKQHLVSNLKVRIKIFLTTTSSTVCTLNMSIKSSRALSSQLLNGLKKKTEKKRCISAIKSDLQKTTQLLAKISKQTCKVRK